MIGLGLSIPQVAVRGNLNPIAALFSSGEEGAWYDPSDLSTMFTTSTGTTAAAVDGPVGLLLDKRKGLARGANVWPQSQAEWNSSTSATAVGAVLTVNRTAGSVVGAIASKGGVIDAALGVGYEWEITISDFVLAESGELRIGGTGNASRAHIITGNGTFSGIKLTEQTGASLNIVCGGGDFKVTATIRKVPGNHATQATAAARPTLRQSAGGLYYLEFDGVDDALIALPDAVTFQDAFLCNATRHLSSGTTALMFGISDGVGDRHETQKNAADVVVAVNAADSFKSVTGGNALADYVSSTVRTGIVVDGRYNGASQGTGTQAGDTVISGTGSIYIGRSPTFTALPSNARFYGGVIRIATTSAEQIASAESFLAAKAGVTL